MNKLSDCPALKFLGFYQDFHPTKGVLKAQITEQMLMEQLAKGNHHVFWQLWLPHRDYLYRCCLQWMNNNATEAEDALDLGMLKAYQKLPQYAYKINNLKAWFRRVCHRLCLDLHRKRQKEKIRDNFPLELIAVESNLETAFTSEIHDLLEKAVNNLPLQLQQPFVLRFYHESSYQEIARSLSISNCNARKRVQLAKTKLRQQLTTYLSKEM